MRVAIDATSLIGARTGVGRFTSELVARLARRDDVAPVAFAVTWRGRGRLRSELPGNVRIVGPAVPARVVRAMWLRSSVPSAERLAGPCEVVHGPNFVVPPARRAAEVLTVHDLTSVRFPELCTPDTLQHPRLIARAVQRGAWVHAVSRFVADEVQAAFAIEAERVVVVPNGITPPPPDHAGTDAALGRHIAGAERYVLALGTVEPRKGLPTLVAAFDAVAAADPDLHLVIAGPDGWGVEALTAARDRASHRRRIHRLGWVSDAQAAALLRGAAVFVYPSRYEGFGLPPLEAMAVGTPVVTTTAGALPETVGDAARLVPPQDPEALAGALSDVLGDDDLRRSLVERGRERVRRYDWDATTSGIVDLYRSAADAR
ncbi:MAG: glycosyltransferase family 4 protein [Actinomycetota bacterium]|nr:glycosyltransferase family 4 protein [Actinomycetota bacterium]